jgi:hypothetical protein
MFGGGDEREGKNGSELRRISVSSFEILMLKS